MHLAMRVSPSILMIQNLMNYPGNKLASILFLSKRWFVSYYQILSSGWNHSHVDLFFSFPPSCNLHVIPGPCSTSRTHFSSVSGCSDCLLGVTTNAHPFSFLLWRLLLLSTIFWKWPLSFISIIHFISSSGAPSSTEWNCPFQLFPQSFQQLLSLLHKHLLKTNEEGMDVQGIEEVVCLKMDRYISLHNKLWRIGLINPTWFM
jgi:hypothetical protein